MKRIGLVIAMLAALVVCAGCGVTPQQLSTAVDTKADKADIEALQAKIAELEAKADNTEIKALKAKIADLEKTQKELSDQVKTTFQRYDDARVAADKAADVLVKNLERLCQSYEAQYKALVSVLENLTEEKEAAAGKKAPAVKEKK